MKKSCRNGILAALVVAGLLPAATAKPGRFPTSAEDVLIVDCLLPGQVRRVGKIKSFLTPRRPARMSQFQCQYRGGEFVSYDRATLSTALAVWGGTAEQGDVDAMNVVGEAYAKGLGMAPDYRLAREWFERAAAGGSRKALQNLGHLHENGLGVPADRVRALDYFRRALGDDVEAIVYAPDAARAGELQDEVERLRAALAERDREADRLRVQLEDLVRTRDAARGELGALKAQYQELRARSSDRSSGDVSAVWTVLEEQLREREGVLAMQESRMRELEAQLKRFKPEPVVEIGRTLTLTLERPGMQLARSGVVVALVDDASSVSLEGVVSPAAELDSLRIGSSTITPGPDGRFRYVLAAGGERMSIVARARDGSETRLEVDIVAPDDAPVAVASRPATKRALPAGARPGAQRALLVAVGGYREFSRLASPTVDVARLANVLERRYGFTVRVLTDPTRLDFLLALHEFNDGLAEADSGLLYFAGHGQIDARNNGYWVMSDGTRDPSSWVANSVVTEMLGVSQARHLLVIADSCYSGTLTRASVPTLTESLPDEQWRAWATASARGRSRLVMTSGGLGPVPEASPDDPASFANNLVRTLASHEGALESQRLYREVSTQIALKRRDNGFQPLPELAPLQYAGHEAGELFFIPNGS